LEFRKYLDFCGIYGHFEIDFWIFWILNNLAPDGARKKTKTDFYSSKQATQLCCWSKSCRSKVKVTSGDLGNQKLKFGN